MNTTAQLPSRAATTLVTWVATLAIVAVLAAVAGLLAGKVGPATVPALIIGLPVAIKATRASNHRKAILRHADALAARTSYQAPATR